MEWFADVDALRRFETWLRTENDRWDASAAGVVEPDASVVIIGEERVMRGAEWLAQRWAHGAMKRCLLRSPNESSSSRELTRGEVRALA